MSYPTMFMAMLATLGVALRPDLKHIEHAASDIKTLLQATKEAVTDVGSLAVAKVAIDSMIRKNATEHMTAADAVVLKEVVTILEGSLLDSLDAAHAADISALNAAVSAAHACNEAVALRLGPGGDIHSLEAVAGETQVAFDDAQQASDSQQLARDDAWTTIQNYITALRDPRECAGFPSGRSFDSMKLFYTSNDYVTEYLEQQGTFLVKATDYEDKDAALAASLASLETAKSLLTVEYCAWVQTLLAGCAAFDLCSTTAADAFAAANTAATQNMPHRQKAHVSAVTIIAHVKSLLGEQDYIETVEVDDPNRYVIDIPALPSPEACSAEATRDRRWSPGLSCNLPPPRPPRRAGQVWTADESSVYELVDEEVDFDTAKQRCADLGGYAATITNEEENQIVGDLCTGSSSTSCWIGFNDEATEGKFVWEDGTEPTVAFWHRDEPNDAGGEDGAKIKTEWNNKWNDARVVGFPGPVVCIVWSSRWTA